MRAKILTTIPDSTSQKFLLVGQISRSDEKDGQGRIVTIFLDFANTRGRICDEDDFDKFYARTASDGCLMGHKVRLFL